MLGVLATEPDAGVSVTQAIDLLWAPAPHDRLRHRISQLVYSLNREFTEPVVVKARDRYRLPAAIVTDYGALVKAISNGQPEEAAQFLRSGLLSELTTPPTDAFSDWLDAKRLELRAQVRQAAVQQWTRLTRQGRWQGAMRPSRALLSLDPRDERALRMLIRAGGMCRRAREAEAAFLSFVESAKLDDADWAPDPETVSLLERIRNLGSETRSRVVTRFQKQPPLIGRTQELTALSTAICPPVGDGLRLVIIRGERGTGKTRLVEESLAQGLLAGVRALRSGSSEFERGILLNPILDALATPDVAGHIAKLADPWRGALFQLLPELHRGPDPPPAPLTLEPDRVPRRLLEALRQLLVALAESEPTILFIDDFHWADPTSVAALRYVGRRWPALPLAMVLAVQTECLQPNDLVSRFLSDPGMRCEPCEFTLAKLAVDAARELVEALAENPIAARMQNRIVELSDRNPFFLVELTRHHLAGHRLPQLDPDDFVPLPHSLARAFEGRLAQLNAAAERVLNVLSVAGRPSHAHQLSKLVGTSAEVCVEALDMLQRLRLVSWDPNGFVVRHKLIAHAVYDRMSMVRRTWVHGQVARYLDEVSGTSTARELAVHYHHARMPGRALQHALAGARLAEKANAVEEVSALLALARRNTDDPLARVRISARLARLHYSRRDRENAPALLAEAAAQLREVHRPQSALIAEIQRLDMLASNGALSPEEAARRAGEYGRKAEQAKHWKAFSHSVELELRIHRREGRVGEADHLVARVRETLDQVEPRSRGALFASLALHHGGDFDAALEQVREAISIARQTRSQVELFRALACLVAIQGVRGLVGNAESISAAHEGETLALESDDCVERYNLAASVGAGYLAIGQLDRARNWLARAESELAEVHPCQFHVALACRLGELALAERDLEKAADHFTRAQEGWTPGMGHYLEVISHSGAGLTALLLGQLERARRMDTRLPEPRPGWFGDPATFVLFKVRMNERRGLHIRGADLIRETAQLIESSQPASWARLKFEEARVRLRHTLPLRQQAAEAALTAAASLGIGRWVDALEALRRRSR